MKKLLRLVAAFVALLLCQTAVQAQEHGEHASPAEAPKAAFDAGGFILDHVNNSYEWHVTTIGHTHVSIPLPIILYSDVQGLVVFMSSNFHHGQAPYKNFSIAHEGAYKGKIVETLSDGSQLRPFDLSLTKIGAAMLFSMLLVCVLFIYVARRYRQRGMRAPKGIQSFIEPLILFVRDEIAIPSLGHERSKRFMPYLLTVFFFIFFSNLLGLIPFAPGGANVTGNIAIPLVLASVTFVIILASTNKGFWGHIFNAPGVPWWLKFPIPLMPVVELMGVLTKPVILMVRLSANITAGHIIALGFYSLIFIFGSTSEAGGLGVSPLSIVFTIFMTLLELLVAFIQAYVFTLLSAMYFSMSKVESHHH